jgi:hypothetical protein
MAKVWIKGYTKPDGTKVKGHYRDVSDRMGSRKRDAQLVNRIRLGESPESAVNKSFGAISRRTTKGRRSPSSELKKLYGKAMSNRFDKGSWAKSLGKAI